MNCKLNCPCGQSPERRPVPAGSEYGAQSPAVAHEPLHLGACLTDGKLHATVMRREPNGHITVVATAEIAESMLREHDCHAVMSPLHHPDTPSKAEFEALYLSLCERPITIHEVARRCWKAGAALNSHVPVQGSQP